MALFAASLLLFLKQYCNIVTINANLPHIKWNISYWSIHTTGNPNIKAHVSVPEITEHAHVPLHVNENTGDSFYDMQQRDVTMFLDFHVSVDWIFYFWKRGQHWYMWYTTWHVNAFLTIRLYHQWDTCISCSSNVIFTRHTIVCTLKSCFVSWYHIFAKPCTVIIS